MSNPAGPSYHHAAARYRSSRPERAVAGNARGALRRLTDWRGHQIIGGTPEIGRRWPARGFAG
jgi:hypothetical protein